MQQIFLIAWGWCISFPSAWAEGEVRQHPAPGVGDLLQVSLSLTLVLVVIALSAWLLRRFARLGGTMGGALRVLGGVSLGARERAILVQVGEQQILLGVAPGRVQTLYVLAQPLSVPQPPADFAAALRALVRENGS
ncbi:Flagellar protein FliO [Gammaproteobacteria bacterium]